MTATIPAPRDPFSTHAVENQPAPLENYKLFESDRALGVQASLLARHAPGFVFEAFCASRLDAGLGGAFGTLPPGAPADALIERAMPQ